jgi:large-conductance mechanosensitive channel
VAADGSLRMIKRGRSASCALSRLGAPTGREGNRCFGSSARFRYGAFITNVIEFVAIGAAVFLFIVKPVNMLLQRYRSPAEEGMPDEERRHQELLAALRGATAR